MMGDVSSLKGRLGWQGLKAAHYRESGPYVVSSAHFEKERIRWDRCPRVTTERYETDANIQLRDGDVLLMKDGAALGKIAYVDALPGPACLNSHLLLFRPIEDSYDSRFIFYTLGSRAFQSYIRVHATGLTFLGISQRAIARFPLDLPTIPEQRQIAAVLDTVGDTIRKTEQIIAKLKQVKQGLLHDLLTSGIDDNGELRDLERHPEQFKESPLGRIPKGWGLRPLREVAEIVDPNPSHRYPMAVASGVPIASTENFVGDDDFDLSFSSRVPDFTFEEQNARCRFHPLDVVFARKGRIGFARPFGPDRKVFSHTVVLMKPRLNESTHRFLLWAVRSEGFFTGIRYRMNFNVGVPTLGVGFLGAVPIPTPPKEEQGAIAAALDGVARTIDHEQEALNKLRKLNAGLMEDLLTGRVRVTKLLEDAAE